MKIKFVVSLFTSHVLAGVLGFAIGIYTLPILIAPPAPGESELAEVKADEQYVAHFKKDLKGSDKFHWGEGRVSLNSNSIALQGTLAPGPDYKLYLSPSFVEAEDEFNQLKPKMLLIGDVKTFNNFVVPVPPETDLAKFNTVIVWCETFGEFITSAKYL